MHLHSYIYEMIKVHFDMVNFDQFDQMCINKCSKLTSEENWSFPTSQYSYVGIVNMLWSPRHNGSDMMAPGFLCNWNLKESILVSLVWLCLFGQFQPKRDMRVVLSCQVEEILTRQCVQKKKQKMLGMFCRWGSSCSTLPLQQ